MREDKRLTRSDRFLIGRKPMAFLLDSWNLTKEETRWSETQSGFYYGATLPCIAVQGPKDQPRVTLGTISAGYVVADWRQDDVPENVDEFLAGWNPFNGVDAIATWNGEKIWTAVNTPKVINQHLSTLRPIWDNLPAVPDDYDGWWLRGKRES